MSKPDCYQKDSHGGPEIWEPVPFIVPNCIRVFFLFLLDFLYSSLLLILCEWMYFIYDFGHLFVGSSLFLIIFKFSTDFLETLRPSIWLWVKQSVSIDCFPACMLPSSDYYDYTNRYAWISLKLSTEFCRTRAGCPVKFRHGTSAICELEV